MGHLRCLQLLMRKYSYGVVVRWVALYYYIPPTSLLFAGAAILS